MSDLPCRHCGTAQPASSRPDDACVQCGRPLRDEVRCPWCTLWTPAGGYCRKCGCKLVPPEHFGVARMLVHKGVDQLSLADRVAALDPGQRETFAAIFAAQIAVLAQRVDELRYCESFLLTRGHAARYEDALIGQLPLSPDSLAGLQQGADGPFDGREDLLPRIFETSHPMSPARTLAAIALLRRGEGPRGLLDEVESTLYSEELGFDAAVALSCWRARPHVYNLPYAAKRACELAQQQLTSERFGAWAAVVLARWSWREPAPEVIDRLREGLSSSDAELRFECALALKDPEQLAAAFDSPDPVKASLARRGLASLGHLRVARALAEGPDDARSEVLRGLEHPMSVAIAEALAAGLPRATERDRDTIVSFVRSERFHELDPAVRAAWHRWAQAGGPGVTPEQAFDLLEWATRQSSDDWPLEPGPEAPAFVEVAARAFQTANDEQRAKLVRDSAFARLAVLADEARLPLLVDLAVDPALSLELFERLYWAHAVSQRESHDARAVDRIFQLWDAAGERRDALVEALAKVARSNRGISGRELFVERIWQRMKSGADTERRGLAAAFESWRDELLERYDADPDVSRDLVDRFRFWADASPYALWELIGRVWDRVPRERTGALVEATFDAAERIVDTHPRTAIAAVSRAAAVLVNAYREEPEPAMDAWVDTLRTRFAPFERRFRSARPESDSETGAENLLEDVETELRLAAEARDRREASARWAQEQARRRQEEAERQRREEEQRRQEREERERQLEVQRRQAEEQRQAQARAQQDADAMAARIAEAVAKAIPKTPSGPLQPRIPLEPLDSEPLLAGTPLPTLVDYVRFMKQMSTGTDVMQLFAAHGLTVQTWPAIVNGWSAILTARTDVGMRFGALMAAPWA